MDVFPRLEMNDLQLYTYGTYQIKMAVQYYEDHIRETGVILYLKLYTGNSTNINYHEYNIDINAENALLLRVRVRSRHSRAIKYFIYVFLDKSLSGLSSILGHLYMQSWLPRGRLLFTCHTYFMVFRLCEILFRCNLATCI